MKRVLLAAIHATLLSAIAVAEDVQLPPCEPVWHNPSGGGPSAAWVCPFEASKWQITITMEEPTAGSCGCPPDVLPFGCDFPNTTVELENKTSTTLEIGGFVGTIAGLPGSPPPGSVPKPAIRPLPAGPTTVGPGGSAAFSLVAQTVNCGQTKILDVSYTSGCPTGCPNGWGSCSIVDVFLSCKPCAQPGG